MHILGRRRATPRQRWLARLLSAPFLGLMLFVLALVTAQVPPAPLSAALLPPRQPEALAPHDTTPDRRPLGAVPVPTPPPWEGDIVNPAAAVQLGKAFFWEEQVGSDDRVACATCHFSAGVDQRTINTMNPGPNGIIEAQPNTTFSPAVDDIQGSQGIAPCTTDPTVLPPEGQEPPVTVFGDPVLGKNAPRQVTGRNAPPTTNAVHNRDNFWDGRARFQFRDPQTGAVVYSTNGSLASQAVGPPLNGVEMSCAGRTWAQLANKLLGRQPLGLQQVDPTDSALGTLAHPSGIGLNTSYDQLIRSAFGNPQNLPNGSGDDHAKIRANFGRIWGQAVQAYVSTLVSGQTPFDDFLAGNEEALTEQEERGLGIFRGKGQCATCHGENLMGDAAVDFFLQNGPVNEDGGSQGFHNNGVRPTADDRGRFNVTGSAQDDGAFKTPILRNVALTSPFFHTGAFATIRSLIEFYSRGGDFRNPQLASRIRSLGLDLEEIAELEAFLGRPLTDPRVSAQQAPFDHPLLCPPNGPVLPAVGAAGTATPAPGACALHAAGAGIAQMTGTLVDVPGTVSGSFHYAFSAGGTSTAGAGTLSLDLTPVADVVVTTVDQVFLETDGATISGLGFLHPRNQPLSFVRTVRYRAHFQGNHPGGVGDTFAIGFYDAVTGEKYGELGGPLLAGANTFGP
ncbi:MAG: hypothetical protein HY689_10145 [Chloroflexi bacterium]|nr:hypothetical protein [Chloroflexota bacterium]